MHGRQEGRFFHGYYDRYCFLPLYAFCGEQLLVAYLRPSNIDGAKHAWAILALLVKRLRREWPEVRITLRGDSGFCRWRMLAWCERHNVSYIIGLAQNARLLARIRNQLEMAEHSHRELGEKVRSFTHFRYAAKSWNCERRVVAKIEHTDKGANPRFIVTNLEGDPRELYERVYCARGEMENRIKEQQLGLFADRTSCHAWWPNQFRLLLSSLAYTLMEAIRRRARSTELANAYRHGSAAEALKDRRRDHPQHASHPLPPVECLPLSEVVCPRRRQATAGVTTRPSTTAGYAVTAQGGVRLAAAKIDRQEAFKVSHRFFDATFTASAGLQQRNHQNQGY